MEMHGEVLKDVEDKIARASRAFGVLCSQCSKIKASP